MQPNLEIRKQRVAEYLRSAFPETLWEIHPIDALSCGDWVYFQIVHPDDWKRDRFGLMCDGVFVLEGSAESFGRILISLEAQIQLPNAIWFGNVFLKFALNSNQFVLPDQKDPIYLVLPESLKNQWRKPSIILIETTLHAEFSAIDRSPSILYNYSVDMEPDGIVRYSCQSVSDVEETKC